ncbi:unnamed protein product [Symbiodinium sp. CCMP2592]|nr:unnamed protein product [Symbiodinium sp. CCMP2592]
MQRGFLLAAPEKTEKKKKSEKKSEQLEGVHVTSSVGCRVEKEPGQPGISILKFDSDVDVDLSSVDGMLKVFAKPTDPSK